MIFSARKLLSSALLLCALLSVPILSFAAYDDVTLTTDVVINTGGVNLSVSGSSAVVESITVDANSFSFTMPSNELSLLQVTSSDRRVLSTNAPVQYITTNECTSSASSLKHAFSGLQSITITVTPQSSTCGTNATSAAVSSSSSSSSSGGSGGVAPAGLINPTPPSTVAQNIGIKSTVAAAVSASVAPTAPVSTGAATSPTADVSPVFTKILSPGKSSPDVKRLQQLLNSDPDTRVAASGIGSPGKESTYFGTLTVKAVKKFQVKYGIARPGNAGYGLFGPKTRAKMQEVFGASSAAQTSSSTPGTQQAATTPASTVSPVFNRALSPGATHGDVKRLQQLLNSDPDTRIAETGPGSIGNESAYFGSLTAKAIKKFQVKYNIAKPGEAGYGLFGPKTRAKIQEVFGK